MTTFKMLKTELCSFQWLFQPIANNYIMPAGSILHPSLLTVTHVIIGSNTPNKKKNVLGDSQEDHSNQTINPLNVYTVW